ncbi:hypothetical protein H0H92_011233 [Tricholoma furcatifolium]|nr:hypothetical protein H0H92_011233 [Tricholoma furcatifolium]
MDLQHDTPPPPYSAIDPICSPITSSPGFPLPSFESATALSDADTGCLPAYQGRPTRRYHPYIRRRHLRIDNSSKYYAPVPIALDDTPASPSSALIGSICGVDAGAVVPRIVFDPNDEHHRRILRLRYVIPQFIHTIRCALARTQALHAVDNPSSVASPDQCVINDTPPFTG